jgi:TolB-like protein/Flp pilus assembly protein TadD
MSFVSELRRRQVFRTAAWYGGLAWLAVEVADTVFPRFGLPDAAVRAVIVAAVLGLPIALALAWWFDLSAVGLRREAPATPAGAQREAPVDHPAVAAPAPLWRVPSFWVALVLGAGLAVSAQQTWQRLVRPAFGERPGLAVLPFANLSANPEDAYFADGLHEEILATLARAGGLRVISRSSVQQYRNPDRNLRDIADALDVTLILEGSVRRASDDVRLTIQLIDGRTDEHLWVKTYDRTFENALELQRTVALQLVSELGASLSPTERRLIEHASPSLPEAYDQYLQALALYTGEGEPSDIESRLSKTLEIDPAFALAYALRAKIRVDRAYEEEGEARDRLGEGARADIERALALQPDLPEALAARGLYHTYVSIDPERGLADLLHALEIAPNDADTQGIAGMTLRRLGRFDEAIGHLEQADALAPDTGWGGMAALTLVEVGRHEAADASLRKRIHRYPTRPGARMLRYYNRYLATGETAGWREEHDRLRRTSSEPVLRSQTERVLICTGDLAALIALYESASKDELDQPAPRDYLLGVAHSAAGDPVRARPYLTAVASMPPSDGYDQVFRAVALELLGRRAEALRAADEAVRQTPEARDAVNGPQVAMLRAWVLIRSGERAEEGYAEFERLLGGFLLQPRWVAAQHEWLMLRDDARLKEIIRNKLPEQSLPR